MNRPEVVVVTGASAGVGRACPSRHVLCFEPLGMGRAWLSSLPTRIAISSKKKLKNRTASTKPSAITATATRISPMAWSPLGSPVIPRDQLNQNATRKQTMLPRNTAAAARLRGQPPKWASRNQAFGGRGSFRTMSSLGSRLGST